MNKTEKKSLNEVLASKIKDFEASPKTKTKAHIVLKHLKENNMKIWGTSTINNIILRPDTVPINVNNAELFEVVKLLALKYNWPVGPTRAKKMS